MKYDVMQVESHPLVGFGVVLNVVYPRQPMEEACSSTSGYHITLNMLGYVLAISRGHR